MDRLRRDLDAIRSREGDGPPRVTTLAEAEMLSWLLATEQGESVPDLARAIIADARGEAPASLDAKRGASLALIDRWRAPLGLTGPVGLRVDPEATLRTRAHDTRAIQEGRTLWLDPERFDPATEDGRTLVAHELVHLAQRAAPRPASPAAVEAEAAHLGGRLARGLPVRRPALRVAGVAREWPTRVNAEGEREHWIEDPEQNYVLEGLLALVRSRWVWDCAVDDPGSDQVRAPEVTREILLALHGAGEFGWTDTQSIEAASSRLTIPGPLRDPSQHEFWVLSADTVAVYANLGLPPGERLRLALEDHQILAAADVGSASRGMGGDLGEGLRIDLLAELSSLTGLPPIDASSFEPHLLSDHGASLLVAIPRDNIDVVFGHEGERWYRLALRMQGLGDEGTAEVPGVVFETDMSAAQEVFAALFIRETLDSPGGDSETGLVVDRALVEAWQRVDELGPESLRARVVELLRQAGSDGWTAGYVDSAIELARMETALAYSGLEMDRGEGWRLSRNGLVEAHIVNHSGRLTPGGDARFSVVLESPPPPLGLLAKGYVRWLVFDDELELLADESGDWYLHGSPDELTHTFDEVGVYRVHALVGMSGYSPREIWIEVEVASVDTQLRRLASRDGGGFTDFGPAQISGSWRSADTGETTLAGIAGFFEEVGYLLNPSSRYEDIPAHSVDYDALFVGTGQLEEDHERLTAEQQRQRLESRLATIDQLIADYGEGTRDEQQLVDLLEDYRDALEALQDSLERTTDAGAIPFEARAVYANIDGTMRSSDLRIDGVAWVFGDGGALVALWDSSGLLGGHVAQHSAIGVDFEDALTGAALALARTYPEGTVRLRAEVVPDEGVVPERGGEIIEIDLPCGSTWEDIRDTVWSPWVSRVVNAVGLLACMFGGHAIALPLLAAYNGVDTLATLDEMRRRGALEAEDVVIGLVDIALNVLPMTRVGSQLRGARVVAFEVGADLLLLSATIAETVEDLRLNAVPELVALEMEIRHLEAVNAADPRLQELVEQRDALMNDIESQMWETFADITLEQAAFWVGGAAARRAAARGDQAPRVDEDAATAPHTPDPTLFDVPQQELAPGSPEARAAAEAATTGFYLPDDPYAAPDPDAALAEVREMAALDPDGVAFFYDRWLDPDLPEAVHAEARHLLHDWARRTLAELPGGDAPVARQPLGDRGPGEQGSTLAPPPSPGRQRRFAEPGEPVRHGDQGWIFLRDLGDGRVELGHPGHQPGGPTTTAHWDAIFSENPKLLARATPIIDPDVDDTGPPWRMVSRDGDSYVLVRERDGGYEIATRPAAEVELANPELLASRPPGHHLAPSDPTSGADADHLYRQIFTSAPDREVALIVDSRGNHMVVLGERDAVTSLRDWLQGRRVEGWNVLAHYHPRGDMVRYRLPSGGRGDFGVLLEQSAREGRPIASSIDYPTATGYGRTEFRADAATNRLEVDWMDADGEPRTRSFDDIHAYHDWLQREFGVWQPPPSRAIVPTEELPAIRHDASESPGLSSR